MSVYNSKINCTFLCFPFFSQFLRSFHWNSTADRWIHMMLEWLSASLPKTKQKRKEKTTRNSSSNRERREVKKDEIKWNKIKEFHMIFIEWMNVECTNEEKEKEKLLLTLMRSCTYMMYEKKNNALLTWAFRFGQLFTWIQRIGMFTMCFLLGCAFSCHI